MTDTWMGDDFFHQGAFRMSYGLEYSYTVESSEGGANFDVGTYDMYDWYLRRRTLGDITARWAVASILEGVCRTSGLRRVLAAKSRADSLDETNRAHSDGRRLVGSGRFLWTAAIYDALEQNDGQVSTASSSVPGTTANGREATLTR